MAAIGDMPDHQRRRELELIARQNREGAVAVLGSDEEVATAAALGRVREELLRATDRFGAFASSHEGYAVILEELDELWDEVKANNTERAIEEAVQVAAMAVRFIVDVRADT